MDTDNIKKFKRKIYFEKQSNDRLCGVHCLNSLLQGPYFDPGMLSEIGLRLDEMENALYSGGPSQHSNVDDDGNYNIQVLTEALKVYGAEIVPLRNSEAVKLINKNMDKVEAFIFNSSTHWFSIRKIDNIWFNLNSTNSLPGPELISDFYLSAFIQGTEDIGYTNFLVNKLPPLPDTNMYSNIQKYQMLLSLDEIIKVRDSKKQKLDEKEEKKEDENKFKAFAGKGYTLETPSKFQTNNFDGDEEMKQAYELSLQEYINDLENYLPKEPEANNETYNIVFKYSDKTFSRKFQSEDKINVNVFLIF